MLFREDHVSSILKLAIWILSALALIIVVVAGIKYTYNQRYVRKIAELEDVVKAQRANMNVESVRQYNIQRVLAIINIYNRSMANHMRYDIAEEIYNASTKYINLDVDLLCAFITNETNGTWNPDLISDFGAMGLLQIMPTTGMLVARSEGLNWLSPDEVLLSPINNIRIGSRYLSALIDAYDVDGAIAARMCGERRAAMWIKSGRENGILPKDTLDYISAILRQYEQFKAFHI
jgi:soluble lytic murein transglycosylase